jgi:serine/threonine protein kinase
VLSYIQARRPFVDKHPEDLQDTDAQPMLSFFQKHDITLSGAIKLVDFGGAFLAADGGKGDSIRRDVAAPERLEGEPWGLPADIWALGCTILELVTGERLFHLNHIPLQERTDGHSIELTRKRLGADETDTAHLKQVVRKVVDRRSVSGVTPAELDVIKEIGVGTLRWRPEDRMDIYEVQRIWKARDTSRGVS